MQELETSRRYDIYAPLLFLTLTVIFYWPFLFQGKAFLAADNLQTKYPWKYYQTKVVKPKNIFLITDPIYSFYPKDYIQNEAVKEGKFNLWNPYILGGYPNFASGTPTGWFYPIKIFLHRIFEPWQAHGYGLFIHTFLMGLGFYLYGKAIGLNPLGAFIGGLSWMFNGYIMVWLEFEHIVFLSAWLPFVLYFSERFIRERKGIFIITAGLSLGLAFLSGHLQRNLYVLILLLYTFLFRSLQILRGTGRSGVVSLWTGLLFTIVLGGGIAAIQILPSIELLLNSQRISYESFQDLLDNTATLPIESMITMLFPFFFLDPLRWVYWLRSPSTQAYANFNELCIYGGVVTFLLALLAITNNKGSSKNYFLILSVISILLAMGTYLYYPLYLIPLFKTLNPTRILYLFAFALSGLSGVGADYLHSLSKEKKKPPRLFVFFISTISLLIAVFYIYKKSIITWYITTFLIDFISNIESATKNLLSYYTIGNILFLLPLLLLISGIILIGLIIKRGSKPLHWSLILLVMIVGFFSFGWRYNTFVSPGYIYPETEATNFLMKQKGIFRVTLHKALVHNSFMPFKIQNVGGYDSMYPRRYSQFMNVVEHGVLYQRHRPYGRWLALTNFNSPLINLLNVKYILLPPYMRLAIPRFRLVYDKDLKIYENTKVLPRAFMVSQYLVMSEKEVLKILAMGGDVFGNTVILEKAPSIKGQALQKGSVVMKQYVPGRLILNVVSPEGGILVFTENFYPGWKAYVDGKKEEILRANYTFMAISIEPGNHTIVFHYDPISFKIGKGLTFLTLTVMLFYSGVYIHKVRSKNKR